jgi:hypothetical protein
MDLRVRSQVTDQAFDSFLTAIGRQHMPERLDAHLFAAILLHTHVLSGGRIVPHQHGRQSWTNPMLLNHFFDSTGNLFPNSAGDSLAINDLCTQIISS